jgi:hypothetical protein
MRQHKAVFGELSLTRGYLLAQREAGLWHRAGIRSKNRTHSGRSTHETSREEAIAGLVALLPHGFAMESATILQAMRQVVQERECVVYWCSI